MALGIRPGSLQVKEDRFGLDMTNATRRLIALLEYPSVGGEVANLRAGAFEAGHAANDRRHTLASARGPLPRTGKMAPCGSGVKTIGEPDAIAERDGACLMVSCKSRVYTAAYDVGHHNVVRNTAEHIAGAVAEWEAFVGELRRNPVGDNYDLSGVRDLRGVVITPTVFYVPMEVVKKKTAEDLKRE